MRKRFSPKKKKYIKKVRNTRIQCSHCNYVFDDYLTRCPECGGEDWIGYTEVNPYTRLPLENLLKSCGHLLWIGGTLALLHCLWRTDNADNTINMLYIYAGITCIFMGVFLSVLYFALSEIIQRVLRVQRRLKAFHETQRKNAKPYPYQEHKALKNKTLTQYGIVHRRAKNQ